MNAAQLARRHGLTIAAVRKRLQRGKPLNDPPQRRTIINRSATIASIARAHDLPYEVAKKRLERGIALDAPHAERKQRVRFSPLMWTPDPLNAVCNEWRTKPLAALGVRRNLKARI